MNNPRISFEKYINWLIFVVLFSALPIVLNNGIDYISDKEKGAFFQGVRLIDYLICAFCIIGGALCERFNSTHKPDGKTVGIGIVLAICLIVIYLIIKYSLFKETAAPGRYPTDNAWIWCIICGYLTAILYSLILMRKTYVV